MTWGFCGLWVVGSRTMPSKAEERMLLYIFMPSRRILSRRAEGSIHSAQWHPCYCRTKVCSPKEKLNMCFARGHGIPGFFVLEDGKDGRKKLKRKTENTFFIKFERVSFLASGLPGLQSLGSPSCVSQSQTSWSWSGCRLTLQLRGCPWSASFASCEGRLPGLRKLLVLVE